MWKAIGLALVAWIVGILLACILWWPLLFGAGLIGGDTYIYFFALKQFYADGLHQNEIWFWNPQIGNGVPVLGESQTGLFYPFYLLAYRIFSLDTAYSLVFMVHYVLAYVFTYWFARALGLGRASSLLCALIFVYGWFPPRSCLEWAMVTGSWMPVVALATYKWMQTGRLRWAWLIAISHAVQLLAGHFHLAFVTDITVMLLALLCGIPGQTWRQSASRRIAVPLFIACGFLLAAYQVLPTWELRQRSQRAQSDFIADLQYGSIPVSYLTQMITPWSTYPIAELLVADKRSNMIEAHFFVGELTMGLVVGLLFFRNGPRPVWPWFVIIGVGILLATGIAIPILQYVPGFSFFRAPGRYALMSQLGFAVLAAECTDRLFPSRFRIHLLLVAAIFLVTLYEFHWISRRVRYVSIIKPAPILRIPESPICHLLGPEHRVLSPAGNLLSLSGASCVPPYLGMGPVEYYRLWNWDRNVFAGDMQARPEIQKILRDTGVTHILTEAPLPEGWPVRQVYAGYDSFLHTAMARNKLQPFFLYQIEPPVARAFFRDDTGNRLEAIPATITSFHPHHIEIRLKSPDNGELVLTELMYPGWTVTVDGRPVVPKPNELFRVIEIPPGEHLVIWTYSPLSFQNGLVIAGVTLAAMVSWTFNLLLKSKRKTLPSSFR